MLTMDILYGGFYYKYNFYMENGDKVNGDTSVSRTFLICPIQTTMRPHHVVDTSKNDNFHLFVFRTLVFIFNPYLARHNKGYNQ